MPSSRPTLSVVLVAQNEADRLLDTLRSVAWADEVVVVDGGSHDGTQEVALAWGARVVENPWPGYAAQKNFAFSQARSDWILGLDADERVNETLARSIQEAISHEDSPGNPIGYTLNRRMIYLGRPLRGGGFWPDRRLRLVRRGRGTWEGPDPHDHLVVEGPTGHLDGELLHASYRDLGDHLSRLARHARTGSEGALLAGRRAGWTDLLLRPPVFFLWRFLGRGGFRDGWRGAVACGMGAFYIFLRFAFLKIRSEEEGRA